MEKGREIADFLRKQPEVEFTYLSVGGGFRGTPNNGNVFVKLQPKARARAHAVRDPERPARQAAPAPGRAPDASRASSRIFGGRGQPISVNVQGPEPSRLKIAAARVLEAVRAVPGVAEPNSSEEGEIPQLDVRVDRQEAWRAGLGIGTHRARRCSRCSPASARRAGKIRRATRTTSSSCIPDSMRTSAADVAEHSSRQHHHRSAHRHASVMVPLSQVADVRAGVGPAADRAAQLEQQVNVSAGVLPGFAAG